VGITRIDKVVAVSLVSEESKEHEFRVEPKTIKLERKSLANHFLYAKGLEKEDFSQYMDSFEVNFQLKDGQKMLGQKLERANLRNEGVN